MKKEYLFVIIAGILAGLVVFGGQVLINLGVSLFQLSFFTQLLMVLFLLPFIFFRKYRPKKGMNWLWLFYGFVAAVTILAQYGALIFGVPVAIVVLLLYTQPLWTILITRIFMKETITKRKIIAVILVLAGMVILVNPFNVSKVNNILGIIVSLIGGIALSCWVIIGSIVSKRKIQPITSTFLNTLLSLPFILLAYPLLSIFIKDSAIISLSFSLPISIWLGLIAFTLFAQIAVSLFYLNGVKKVSASDAGIILLLEPVVGALLATIFLHQALTVNIIIGGILILTANYLVIREH